MKIELNIPNQLAILRVLLSLVLFVLLVNRGAFGEGIHESWFDLIAGFIFVIAALTDYFDGAIARGFNMVSDFGKVIDPLADKMMVLSGFLGLVVLGRAEPWIVYLILVREFFITGLRVVAASKNIEVSASVFGKAKTFAQIFAIGFLIMNWPFGELLLWIAFVLTLYSGYEYTRAYMK